MRDVPSESLAFPVALPRHAYGPRLAPHAGDVWRAMQDVVVDQSASVGWTAERYVQANTMFVVRTMAVTHAREVRIGEALFGRTWPSRARRDMLFTRQVRLFGGGELVASATQEWAYLTRDLEPTRAGPDIYSAFSLVEGYPEVTLPVATPRPVKSEPERFDFVTWHGWMDPHNHANHAAYVDYCDEGVARWVAARGHDPQQLVPVAESVHFRAAIGAATPVTIETTPSGTVATHEGTAGVFEHRILVGGKAYAIATTVRRLLGAVGDSWLT